MAKMRRRSQATSSSFRTYERRGRRSKSDVQCRAKTVPWMADRPPKGPAPSCVPMPYAALGMDNVDVESGTGTEAVALSPTNRVTLDKF